MGQKLKQDNEYGYADCCLFFENISFSGGRHVLATHVNSQVEQIERARIGLIVVGFDFDSQLPG